MLILFKVYCEIITTNDKIQLNKFFSVALKQMLNLNQVQSKPKVAEPVWKILIYDKYGQDIISPLISVKELRELGVTLHM